MAQSEPLLPRFIVGTICAAYLGMLVIGTVVVLVCGGKDWLEREMRR